MVILYIYFFELGININTLDKNCAGVDVSMTYFQTGKIVRNCVWLWLVVSILHLKTSANLTYTAKYQKRTSNTLTELLKRTEKAISWP